ncbi:hypothetical protein ASPWEDRAFT_674836 [Aspergillus wentii DTO 134E9]|uniref:Bactericidal permeability-increasing protein n=1 Tax=Aspergillus wentii DTO 134E9 TaxID=1073089 RepID=A0A1L9R7T9_ASPWE|nr:uncharacterized protein ASPWEDRAFT_674836 [Aspergillus wentii DTO 134E9]OJJ30990.1 hypothetical protein ASPWEDRAFT_674836 [Aspergillus wentii DTO 134E9]
MPQGETEPLLPRYEHDTVLQRRLHQKLHTYQMLRALSEGYMPSTDQVISNLRTLLASDVLNQRNQDYGTVSRQLVRDTRALIQASIDFLREKNSDDKLQEFLWHLSLSTTSVDTSRVSQQASLAKSRADTRAAYDSLRTVGSLFLSNADFRLFVDDLTTVGRQIFSDTAFSLSTTAQQAGEQLKPSEGEVEALQGAGADRDRSASNEDLHREASEVAGIAGSGVARTSRDAIDSAKGHLSGKERETLFYRLKQAVLNLKERSDYSNAVETISQLIQRYAKIYAHIGDGITAEAEEAVDTDGDLKQAVQQFWALLQSLGDAEEWKKLEQKFHEVLTHADKDPEFEKLASEIGASVQEMLTNPESLDSASEKVDKLKEKSKQVGAESNLRQDVDDFLAQAKRALQTVSEDAAVSNLTNATEKLYNDLVSGFSNRRSDLVSEMTNIFLPTLLRNIQYVPIPRLEISAPKMDLLLETLILEPGHTVNFSSFLPYQMHITTKNDIDVLKKHSKRVATDIKTTFTATIFGLNVSSEEFGYWIRTQAGPFFRFTDEGTASFYLDRRGIDISLDVEVGRQNLEQVFSLRGVRVRIHKLNYKIHRSKWRFLLWLTKPFLKHRLRRVLEKHIAENIVRAAHVLNRELVFARERLRAARIANPQDLASFVRAILARMQPFQDSDVEAGIGENVAGHGVFKGVYTPGSIVKVWHEEATRAEEAIEEGDESHGLRKTWRNDIFDIVGVRR